VDLEVLDLGQDDELYADVGDMSKCVAADSTAGAEVRSRYVRRSSDGPVLVWALDYRQVVPRRPCGPLVIVRKIRHFRPAVINI
jgi:hypothetical protein